MKKLRVSIILVSLTLILASCSRQVGGSPEQTHLMTKEERVDSMLKDVRIDKIIESGKDEVGQDEFQIEAVDDADYSGEYIDNQGTSDIYSSLILNNKDGATYECEVSLYRLTSFTATALSLGEGELYFESMNSGINPYVNGYIQITGDQATLKIGYASFSELGEHQEFEFIKN